MNSGRAPFLPRPFTQALRPGGPWAWQMASHPAADLPVLCVQGSGGLTLFPPLVHEKERWAGSQKWASLGLIRCVDCVVPGNTLVGVCTSVSSPAWQPISPSCSKGVTGATLTVAPADQELDSGQVPFWALRMRRLIQAGTLRSNYYCPCLTVSALPLPSALGVWS